MMVLVLLLPAGLGPLVGAIITHVLSISPQPLDGVLRQRRVGQKTCSLAMRRSALMSGALPMSETKYLLSSS